MKYLFLALFLVVTFVGASSPQSPPRWLESIPSALKKMYPKGLVKVSRNTGDKDTAQLQFSLRDGNRRVSVEIGWLGYGDIPNAVETLRGYKIIYCEGEGSLLETQKIETHGDEGVGCYSRTSNSLSRLLFRRGKTLVVMSVSEDTAFAFEVAKVIDAEISK